MHGSKHRTTDGLYESRKDGSGYSSTKREWNLQTHGFNDETSSHRKYIRTQSSSNNRTVPSTSQQQQRQNGDKDKKTVKDSKKPIRVSGDWSEFQSSTGKTYFYNSKTEVSQWEKPKGWLSDDSSSLSSRASSSTRKESTNAHPPSTTVRPRYTMEESTSQSRQPPPKDTRTLPSSHKVTSSINGHTRPPPVAQAHVARLPSPDDDDSSRMSFSSASSKHSPTDNASNRTAQSNGTVLQSSLSEPAPTAVPDAPKRDPTASLNGNPSKNSTIRSVTSTELDSSIPKPERDHELHKYYRAHLIQHLTDWSSTQLEKQCLKLFADYYAYSAKMSTAFIELKALKSNFRVLEIKRHILTQRLRRCQQHIQAREDGL